MNLKTLQFPNIGVVNAVFSDEELAPIKEEILEIICFVPDQHLRKTFQFFTRHKMLYYGKKLKYFLKNNVSIKDIS
jgi:hypothetical protein